MRAFLLKAWAVVKCVGGALADAPRAELEYLRSQHSCRHCGRRR